VSTATPTGRAAALAELREGFGELLAAERRLRGRDQHRRDDDLTNAQVRALFALGRHQEATAGQIAEAAHLSPASVTGMLDDLERAGVVTRTRSADDRRRVLVRLTDEGCEILAKRRRRWAKRWEQAMADVPDADLAMTAEVMRRIGDLLGEL
jgi:DNA-binding MarR family transcriptional regulator